VFEQAHDLRVALRLQVDDDCRIAAFQRGNRRRQNEARLRVRRRDRQLAFLVATDVRRDRVHVARLGEDDARAPDHLVAGRGDFVEALALAREQLESELALELFQLFGKTGLGRVDAFGGERDVESGVGNGNEVSELREGHVIGPQAVGVGDLRGDGYEGADGNRTAAGRGPAPAGSAFPDPA
jgi:hypothetical protein